MKNIQHKEQIEIAMFYFTLYTKKEVVMKREFISERCLPALFLSGILLLLSLLIVPTSNAVVQCQCMGAIADAKATVEVTANQIKADLA